MGVGPRMKTGSITITAAQVTAAADLDIEVGFIPNNVRVVFGGASEDQTMILEKFGSMADLTSLVTTQLINDGGSTATSVALTTSIGLSDFDSDAIAQEGTALTVGTTLDITAGSTTVTGVGTLFTTEVEVGDRVRVGDELLEIESITSALIMDATSEWGTTTGPDAATVVKPGAEVEASGAKGFTIPWTTQILAADVLYYIAQISQFEEDE